MHTVEVFVEAGVRILGTYRVLEKSATLTCEFPPVHQSLTAPFTDRTSTTLLCGFPRRAPGKKVGAPHRGETRNRRPKESDVDSGRPKNEPWQVRSFAAHEGGVTALSWAPSASPATLATGPPAGQPGSQAARQPGSQAARQLARQPARQPAGSMPGRQPARQTAGPARQGLPASNEVNQPGPAVSRAAPHATRRLVTAYSRSILPPCTRASAHCDTSTSVEPC